MKKLKKKPKVEFKTKIVKGKCEGCELDTLLVCLDNTFYRCISCGEDLEQKVNGVIKYIKVDRNTDLNKSHRWLNKTFRSYTPRDKPKKRPGKHKKSLSKSEKNNNRHKKYHGQGR